MAELLVHYRRHDDRRVQEIPDRRTLAPRNLRLNIGDIQAVQDDGFAWGNLEVEEAIVLKVPGKAEDLKHLAEPMVCLMRNPDFDAAKMDADDEYRESVVSKRRHFVDLASAVPEIIKANLANRHRPVIDRRNKLDERGVVIHDFQKARLGERQAHVAKLSDVADDLDTLDGQIKTLRLPPVEIDPAHIYARREPADAITDPVIRAQWEALPK